MSTQKNDFHPNMVLLDMFRFVDLIRQMTVDKDGKTVGLKNGLKQMVAQSGQSGIANIIIDGTKVKAVLNEWVPARGGIGFDGEKVEVGGMAGSELTAIYQRGLNTVKGARFESAYLITWLALSVLNGRTPTSGAPNLETSHKANVLYELLTKYKNTVKIESVSMDGAIHKATGHKFPNLTADQNTVMAIAGYARVNSDYMISTMSRKPNARSGIHTSDKDSIASM